eukprot:2297358-Alexandrium_andersonii.AAC.1
MMRMSVRTVGSSVGVRTVAVGAVAKTRISLRPTAASAVPAGATGAPAGSSPSPAPGCGPGPRSRSASGPVR